MYAAYIALFEPLLGASAPARPLQVENAVKVGAAGAGGNPRLLAGLHFGLRCNWMQQQRGSQLQRHGLPRAGSPCREGALPRSCRRQAALHAHPCRRRCAPPTTPAPPLRPLCRPPQVGQKRGRSQLEELNAEVLDGTKRKKIRLVSFCSVALARFLSCSCAAVWAR